MAHESLRALRGAFTHQYAGRGGNFVSFSLSILFPFNLLNFLSKIQVIFKAAHNHPFQRSLCARQLFRLQHKYQLFDHKIAWSKR
jgi:hypothetical protein